MFKLIILSICIFFSTGLTQKKLVKTGADVLITENLSLLKGKSVGIITNNSSLLSNGTHLVDTLLTYSGFTIKALFAPEHGIRINAADGDFINDTMDVKTGLPVISLYDENRKPTPEMLKGIDLIIYDLQDIGVRFYTKISTLFYALQAAGENNIPIIVLDRPNPINGISVNGPVREEEVTSFVGIAPIPVMYGMTIGELAKYYLGEKIIGDLKVDLQVIKLDGWDRKDYFDDLALEWTRTSPNIPFFETALVYPGTCLIEGTNVSEGRGTTNPFLTIGAPYINADKLITELESLNISGVKLTPVEFTPVVIPGVASNPKHAGIKCSGINIHVTDKTLFQPLHFGIKLICSLQKLFPDSLTFRDYFDTLIGNRKVRQQILNGEKPDQIIAGWQEELQIFSDVRKNYLLY